MEFCVVFALLLLALDPWRSQRTKRLGVVLKMAVLLSLPVPLVLWPIFGIVGSLLGGIGYGIFTTLIATFEAIEKNDTGKSYHCFVGFTDFCFRSYFSFMDELSGMVPVDEKPIDIKLSKLPGCLLASLISVPVDVLFITAVALWRSPYTFKGCMRLLEDLIGRGPFLETVCVPFAALAILLWLMAFDCCESCYRCYYLQLLSWALQWSYCPSGRFVPDGVCLYHFRGFTV